ncbi:MAG: TonB-dependent receptor [Pseudomonadota bacterium]
MTLLRKKPLAVAALAFCFTVEPVLAQLEEITVTARRVEENLQDVPISVTAFSASDLARRGIQNLEDVAAYTPGLAFEEFSGALEAPVIRGQTQVRLSNPVQNVATFLDGVYLQRSYMIDTGMVALDRIEVVKGPQSALYGQNSFAGAINYVTQKPTEEFEGNIEIGAGSEDFFTGRATISGPIIEDKLLGRITYGQQEYDGTWQNAHPLANQGISPGSDGNLGGFDNDTIAANLTWLPTEDIKVELGYYRTNIEQEAQPIFTRMGRDGVSFFGFAAENSLNCSPTFQPGLPFLGANNALLCGEFSTELPATASADGDSLILDPRSFGQSGRNEVTTFRVEWAINDDWNLTYLYGNADSRLRSGGQAIPDAINGSGNPNSLLNFFPGFVIFDSQPNGGLESDSHEVRFDYDSGGLIEANFGLFYYDSEDLYEAIGYFLFPLGTDSLPSLPNVDENPDFFADETTAVFGRVGFNLMDGRLKLSAEARYSQEDKAVETIGVPNTAASDTFNIFTPRVTLDYALTDENLLYLSIAQGTKAGGFNSPILGGSGNPIDASQATYDEESNWTFEVGTKNRFLDGSLVTNVALFYIDWSDLQINTSAIGGAANDPVVIDNVGGASTWGIEIDGIYQATENLTLNYGFSYNDPKFDGGTIFIEAANDGWCDDVVCNANGDIGGNAVSRTPKLQSTLGAQWTAPLTNTGWDYYARADLTYQSRQFLSLLNAGWVPSRQLLNTRLGVTSDNWDVSLWARNLSNERYVSNSLFLGFSNAYVAALGELRTYGLTATYRF